MKKLIVIGLNSGTSMDGIDAALFAIAPLPQGRQKNSDLPALSFELISSLLLPFPSRFVAQLKKVASGAETDIKTICLLNTALGELFAEAAVKVANAASLTITEVDLIGSHGQTVWHVPDATDFLTVTTNGSLQIGEPAVIAARTGVPVICDFRAKDLAYGGQGAPLVSFADQVIFGNNGIACGVLNIGGIANLTVIDASGQACMAFDTGPGNLLIDYACQQLFGEDFDRSGNLAEQGTISKNWLAQLLTNPYFKRNPPKTTGRELFGQNQADLLLADAKALKLSDYDCLATLTALTAASIAEAYSSFVSGKVKIERLILGGGGAENHLLVRLLQEEWPHELKIARHEDYGISSKFKEALLFALLAYTTHFGIANNVPACTGARKKVCLGKIVQPM